MHTIHSQDQSTQAMTEVALALSMAFFSLLLVALVSLGVPDPLSGDMTELHQIDDVDSLKLNASAPTSSKAAKTNSENDKPLPAETTNTQFVFYFNEDFYDQHLQLIDTSAFISQLSVSHHVVLVMPTDTTLSDALAVQATFDTFDDTFELSLTVMNEPWQTRFESAF